MLFIIHSFLFCVVHLLFHCPFLFIQTPSRFFHTITHYPYFAKLIMDFSQIPIMRPSISQHTNLCMKISLLCNSSRLLADGQRARANAIQNTDTKWKSCLPSIICRCQAAGTAYRSCQFNHLCFFRYSSPMLLILLSHRTVCVWKYD